MSKPVELTETQVSQLLDFSKPLDVSLLECAIEASFSSKSPQEIEICNRVLTTIKEHPESWSRANIIIETSNHPQAKFFGLQILEKTVNERWNLIPQLQREELRKYIVGAIVRCSSSIELMAAHKVFLTKLNMILVQILKKDWPHAWPTFIPDIVASSQKSETLCLNTMNILSLFSEEIFEFSSGQMTRVKVKRLKSCIASEFSSVFSLCLFVFENSTHVELLNTTLNTLLKFLSWIPLGYIFETKLLEILYNFLTHDQLRNNSMKCLIEVACVKVNSNDYRMHFVLLAQGVQRIVTQLVPFEKLAALYENSTNQNHEFVSSLALFYAFYLKGHAEVLEAAAETHTLLLELHQCLLAISEVDDREIFKVCLEYWRFFSELMYTEASQPLSMVLEPKRRSLYTNKTDIMNPLRRVLISKMVKPEEVLVVENENGELVREFMPAHTDTLSMFQTMQETLVYLTRLDFDSTKSIMVDMLSAVVLSPNWTWQRLNTLCWAIGAISGTMPITEEEQFLVKVIKYLLGLCDQAKGKSNKAVVASNIMYVVGQYPRFLKAHWNFLSVVVKKLFEFMHESHEGVQDMSCDTFLKISKQCARSFVTIHVGESHPFVNGILSDLRITISDLQPQQVETFYEAVGHMIAAQNDLLTKQGLIMSLMELPNQLWTHCIRKVAVDQNELRNEEVLKSLSNVLRLNIRACQAIGHEFVVQIDKVFSQMLTLYNVLSNMIAEAAVAYGEVTFRQPLYRRMHSLKHDFLCLLKTWIGLSNNWEYLRTTYLGQILGPILDDYRSSAPPAKEPEVLQLLKALCDTYGQLISASIPIVFDAVFECTLDMITKDLSAYPTHRINFYRLLASVSGHCFQAFVEVTAKHFQLIIDSVVWAMKHAMRNVCESGLNILHHILSGVGSTGFAQQFYTTYYLTLLGHLLSILTDSTYQHAFDKMASILSLMIDAVDAGRIRHPLSPEHSSNKECVQAYLRETLTVAFPTLHSAQAETIIQQLFTHYADSETFKGVLSDFLVQTKVYEDEREIEAYTRDAQEQMLKVQERKNLSGQIPGFVSHRKIGETQLY